MKCWYERFDMFDMLQRRKVAIGIHCACWRAACLHEWATPQGYNKEHWLKHEKRFKEFTLEAKWTHWEMLCVITYDQGIYCRGECNLSACCERITVNWSLRTTGKGIIVLPSLLSSDPPLPLRSMWSLRQNKTNLGYLNDHMEICILKETKPVMGNDFTSIQFSAPVCTWCSK